MQEQIYWNRIKIEDDESDSRSLFSHKTSKGKIEYELNFGQSMNIILSLRDVASLLRHHMPE